MTQSLVIRSLRFEELQIVLEWARVEGWNPGINDTLPFWNVDPSGFIGGFLGEKLVASVSAVNYNNKFGFIGFFIVSPEYRGFGYGLRVWKAALSYLNALPSIGLDGVLSQQENYKKSGFVYIHQNCRYQGLTPLFGTATSERVRKFVIPAKHVSFDALDDFDRKYFPSSRTAFLRDWINTYGHKALVSVEDGCVSGFGVIRKCCIGYKIGPLFAESLDCASAITYALCENLEPGTAVFIDPPSENHFAIKLMRDLGMSMVFETARMYKGTIPKIPIHQVYGITTFELG